MELMEWLSFEQVVYDEFIQAREEGKEIDGLEAELTALKNQKGDDYSGKLRDLYERVTHAKIRADFPYIEPILWDDIEKERPRLSSPKMKRNLGREELLDRIYGAWLGRCAGCLLGKPVEGMSHDQIQAILEWKHNSPLNFYIAQKGGLPPDLVLDPEQEKRYLTGTFENVHQMLRDDDIDYTLIGLHILENYGLGFTSSDVGVTWLQTMPLLMTYTAERVAYRNFANRISPPASGYTMNPYREWIGAQIRADIWGYINPGRPEAAAELAFRDAVLSHSKNGVYGELFFAAAIATAFAVNDISWVIQGGLSVIPAHSRFSEAVRRVMEWSHADGDWQVTLRRIFEYYGNYNWFHTIPNAAIIIMALLYGGGDFERTITIAVSSGLDTDCNGATAGSIIGAYLGASRLPSKWIEPLNDRVSTAVVGMSDSSIHQLAERTIAFVR